MEEGMSGFVPASVLADINLERPAAPLARPETPAPVIQAPTCENCPFHATDPTNTKTPTQCRYEVVTSVFPQQDQLGRVNFMFVAGYPQPNGPCGKHPWIKAKAAHMENVEFQRLSREDPRR